MVSRKIISKEQYFTPQETADQIVKWLDETGQFDGVETIIEPCCGELSLVNAVKELHPTIKVVFSDLHPINEEIPQADGLKIDLKQFDEKTTKVFSNPPFGRSNSLTKKFIRYYSNFDSCQIVTKSMKFGEIAFMPEYQQVDQLDIEPNFYNYENKVHHKVDCCAIQFNKQRNTQYDLFLEAYDQFEKNIGSIESNKYKKMLKEYRDGLVDNGF